MLQMLTKPVIVVASEVVAPEHVSFASAAPIRPPIPAVPEAGERSVKHLIALADLAHKAGDLESAEELIRRIYAHYDQQRSTDE